MKIKIIIVSLVRYAFGYTPQWDMAFQNPFQNEIQTILNLTLYYFVHAQYFNIITVINFQYYVAT